MIVTKLDLRGDGIGLQLQQDEYDVAGLHERPIIDVMAREIERKKTPKYQNVRGLPNQDE